MSSNNHVCNIFNEYLICSLCDEVFPNFLKEDHYKNVHPNYNFKDWKNNSEYKKIIRSECYWCPQKVDFLKPNYEEDYRLAEISLYKCLICKRNDIRFRHLKKEHNHFNVNFEEIVTHSIKLKYKCNKCYHLFSTELGCSKHKCKSKSENLDNWRETKNSSKIWKNWRDSSKQEKRFPIYWRVPSNNFLTWRN